MQNIFLFTMTMNRVIILLFCIGTIILMTGVVRADVLQPFITHVYFEKDGIPYNFPVKYTVTCYGYERRSYFDRPLPGSYHPSPIYRYSASCNGYGCPVYAQYFSLFGASFDWCDLDGETNYQKFSLHNLSTDITRCDRIAERGWRIQDNGVKYYYWTPEYDSCYEFRDMKNDRIGVLHARYTSTAPANSSELIILKGRSPYYAMDQKRDGLIVNKSEIPMNLDQYINYLETCNPTADRKCPGWIIDGKPLKSFTEYRTLRNDRANLQEDPCDTFLVEADPSLVIPFGDQLPWRGECAQGYIMGAGGCNYTYGYCESRFTIPPAGDLGSTVVRTPPETPVFPVSPIPPVIGTSPPIAGTTAVTQATAAVSRLPPATNHGTPTVTTFPIPTPSRNAIDGSSPVESLYCSILSWFDISCDNV
jgi:hypothetical protein